MQVEWHRQQRRAEAVIILKNFINIFNIPELRKKLLFTLGVLVVFRLGCHIPVIGIDLGALNQLISNASSMLGGLFRYLDIFSGGALSQSTLFALGVMPYVTASIMMQVLTLAVPQLEQMAKEGEYGRKIINQYTRYLAVFIAIIQSSGYIALLKSQNLVVNPGWGFNIIFVISLTVGSLFVMWLGEQISLFGIGNGSSMIIFAGIVARFPEYLGRTIHAVRDLGTLSVFTALLILLIYLAITACIVFLEKGERKIPVQYSRRVVGNKVYGGQSTYIPLKLNSAGVMPVIFTGAVLQIPIFITSLLVQRGPAWLVPFSKTVADILNQNGLLFNVLQFLLIIAFSYFYTAIIFNPEELADNIKKGGGFIPGIRPGKKTAEFFNYLLLRIGLIGAIYLGLLALSPNIMTAFISNMPFILGGTGLLIVVLTALELAAQMESYLIEHRYEGFVTGGRLKPRSVR
jgi:preprotein translocase subunit SecY